MPRINNESLEKYAAHIQKHLEHEIPEAAFWVAIHYNAMKDSLVFRTQAYPRPIWNEMPDHSQVKGYNMEVDIRSEIQLGWVADQLVRAYKDHGRPQCVVKLTKFEI